MQDGGDREQADFGGDGEADRHADAQDLEEVRPIGLEEPGENIEALQLAMRHGVADQRQEHEQVDEAGGEGGAAQFEPGEAEMAEDQHPGDEAVDDDAEHGDDEDDARGGKGGEERAHHGDAERG